MEKLKMHSMDKVRQKAAKLGELFPNCVTERKNANGEMEYAIDFEVLKQELSGIAVDSGGERYQFTWPDKRKSIQLANTPIAKTLRPCREESVAFDTTENLYIEGDNLDVLKLLQETYLGKIKMIYIDPPYNTGNDFVYNDDFSVSTSAYLAGSGQFDTEGNRLVQNTETNGRFHTDWLNMMYTRIRLAKDLLSEDGVLVMSISDAEFHNLKKITDEIFGEFNYCGDILWNSTKSVTNTALISVSHTYNLVYFKSMHYFIEHRSEFRLPDEGEGFENPDNDPRGPWKADPFQVGGWRPNQQYEIVNPKTGAVYKPNPGCSWKNDYKKYLELLADNRIVFGKAGDSGPQRKRFAWEAQERGKVAKTWWDDVDTTTNGTQLLKKLFDGVAVFDNPKPVGLLIKLLQLGTKRDSVVLDFFSGSATTAHAVMKLNAQDGGHRKFIMVQLPEETPEGSLARNAGYFTIPQIGKERIRRAGAQIRAEMSQCQPVPDLGFRVLKLDSSNMKDVYYAPAEYELSMFEALADNIKEDRTPEDLLFQVMLDLGVQLSNKIEQSLVAGRQVFNVADGFLMACFDENVSEATVTAVARQKPRYFVMRDSSMASDAVAANFDQIFATYSADTVRRVL